MTDSDRNRSVVPRADTAEAASSDIFEPGADPETWIDHIAAVYRERPNAVLRELLQNAVDSMRDVPTDARFIEVAILSQDLNSRSVDYHLVVRDVGVGMDERTLKRALGILGFSNKGRSDTAIGEFGIGFYSTHAICDDVAVISRSGDSDLTAWHYVPAEKRFHRLQGDQLAKIIRRDYRDHPRPARARAGYVCLSATTS